MPRALTKNAPCRRRGKPTVPDKPTADDAAYEAFVPKRFAASLTADRVALADDEAADLLLR